MTKLKTQIVIEYKLWINQICVGHIFLCYNFQMWQYTVIGHNLDRESASEEEMPQKKMK